MGAVKWLSVLIAVVLANLALRAQQMRPVQPPPVLRTERVGTAPPPAQIFKVFQFPADKIPRIDGDDSDWAMVPESYSIGLDQMSDDEHIHDKPDPKELDVHVKVGWVKGLNRLYFLYEAYKNFWDFADSGLHNDTFEIVVDGDRSGGPLIPQFRNNADQDEWDAHFSMHGVQAQNYHIMTPSEGKDWALAWGCQPWIKELPWANHAQKYSFKHGESGKYILEFYITPFDYAGCEGPQRAVESELYENKIIGLSWAVIDYDGEKHNNGFWNLGTEHTMYGNATLLREFRLMPLEAEFQKPIEARWSFKVLDMNRRLVAFEDESVGNVTGWRWEFGDGTSSSEQHPIHAYAKAGQYVVVLYVEGPAGKSRLSKIWDVTLR
ncbi:MAG: PKD domain-containing protein [Terracidiphilus sp.]|jgi:hypothetical protein